MKDEEEYFCAVCFSWQESDCALYELQCAYFVPLCFCYCYATGPEAGWVLRLSSASFVFAACLVGAQMHHLRYIWKHNSSSDNL